MCALFSRDLWHIPTYSDASIVLPTGCNGRICDLIRSPSNKLNVRFTRFWDARCGSGSHNRGQPSHDLPPWFQHFPYWVRPSPQRRVVCWAISNPNRQDLVLRALNWRSPCADCRMAAVITRIALWRTRLSAASAPAGVHAIDYRQRHALRQFRRRKILSTT